MEQSSHKNDTEMKDYLLIELTKKDSITSNFETIPRKRHLGGEIGEGTITEDRITIRVGNHPIAYNLRKLYELSGKVIPDEMEIFHSYNLWIVNYNIAVLKSGGWRDVKEIGLKILYKEPSFVNIIEILPKSEFIKIIDGKLAFNADLGLNGHVSPSNLNLPLLGIEKAIGLGGKLNLSTENSLIGNFNFSVLSPLVMSVGVGSNISEWIINKGENPLYGDDITFTNIIMVDDHIDQIEIEAMVYTNVPVFNAVPSRRSSKLMPITFELKN